MLTVNLIVKDGTKEEAEIKGKVNIGHYTLGEIDKLIEVQESLGKILGYTFEFEAIFTTNGDDNGTE